MKIPSRILFPLLCALLMARAQARLNVVASTPDFGAIAQEIGRDRIKLTTLARPTEDPHFVDAKPSFIVKLNRADALVEGGAELEAGWLPPPARRRPQSPARAGKTGTDFRRRRGLVARDSVHARPLERGHTRGRQPPLPD